MTAPASPSHTDWYTNGRLASYVRAAKTVDGLIGMTEAAQPPGDMSDPPVSDLVLVQALSPGLRQTSNLGGGRFRAETGKDALFLIPPGVASEIIVDTPHAIRCFAFPTRAWRETLTLARRDGGNGDGIFDFGNLHSRSFVSRELPKVLARLWLTSQGRTSADRLLVQSATCAIFAELMRLADVAVAPERGGLAPWAERRCTEMMRERLAEDISLAELASEARLSPFHFARMFKQSVGVAPHAYLVQCRIEKACELLATTDLSVTEISQAVGYSSSQALNRVFVKAMGATPTAYRRERRQ